MKLTWFILFKSYAQSTLFFYIIRIIPSFSMLEKTPRADKISHVRVKTAIYHV